MKSKLALVSLILGIFSLIHLAGVEKAVLAVVFGTMALKEASGELKSRKMAWVGISLGLLYLVVVTIILVFFFPQLKMMIEKLK